MRRELAGILPGTIPAASLPVTGWHRQAAATGFLGVLGYC